MAMNMRHHLRGDRDHRLDPRLRDRLPPRHHRRQPGRFPGNANGQQVFVGGKLVGSKIIGQNFADPEVKNGKTVLDKNGNPVTNPDPRYFQSRPSATVPADNAAATAFSNLGPNSIATEVALAANIQAYIALERPYDQG